MLLDDLRHAAGANRAATLADSEAQALEAESAAVEAKDIAEADAAAEPKKRFFKKADKAETPAANKQDKGKIEKKAEKKVESKPKKRRFGFLKDVRAEMKRVTWPTKKDVLRWSVVVVAALLFFGVYVALLDNVIITPVLVGISSLGA